jgi:hypothetical protein
MFIGNFMKILLLKITLCCVIFTLLVTMSSFLTLSEKIVDGEEAFIKFYNESNGMDISQSQQLYKELIESLAPKFYEEAVYYKGIYKDNWQEKRLKSLESNFKFYQSTPVAKYKRAYEDMRIAVKKGFTTFKSYYPLYEPNITIMLTPGITWGGSYTHASDGEYMAVGVDLLVMEPELMPIDKIDFLIVHELSHDYHQQFFGDAPTDKFLKEEFTFTDRMWQEGLANWLAWQTNKNYQYGNLSSKGKLDDCIMSELAPEFLAVSDLLIFSEAGKAKSKDWFSPNSVMTLKNEDTVAPMVGYLMGAYVFNELVKAGQPIETLLSWKYETARKEIKNTLKKLSNRPECLK